jgi:ferrous iron transport protein A
MIDCKPLTQYPPGSLVTIGEIKLAGPDRLRLQELGLVMGTPVDIIRYAPLGDPVEIRVRGYHLTLRRHEADLVLVGPTGS